MTCRHVLAWLIFTQLHTFTKGHWLRFLDRFSLHRFSQLIIRSVTVDLIHFHWKANKCYCTLHCRDFSEVCTISFVGTTHCDKTIRRRRWHYGQYLLEIIRNTHKFFCLFNCWVTVDLKHTDAFVLDNPQTSLWKHFTRTGFYQM